MMLKPCKLLKTGFSAASSTSTSLQDEDMSVKISREDDHISKLPDEILGLIISHLTLRDATRTRVLSHRWRYVRPSHSDLLFDWHNMFPTPENLQLFDNSQQQLCPCAGYLDKFVRGVSQFLESYDDGKQAIRCFSVIFCVQSFAGDVDGWVRSAIKMRAQTLSLALYCRHMICRTWPDIFLKEYWSKYLFRSELLEGAQANLRHLRLYGCNLGTNFTNQFSSLESLFLTYVSLSNYDLQSLFSSLVKLKALRLWKCTLPKKLCLGPLLCLESFKLVICCGVTSIELCNANLSEFEYYCSQVFTLIFNGVPNLWKFTCFPNDDEQFRCTFTLLPQQLPKLRELYIKTREDWVNKIPQSIGTFKTVTRLSLAFFQQMKFDLLKMVSIFKAFPFLRQLHMMMCCQEDIEQGQPEHRGYVHEHLEEFKFCGFCTSSQIEFAIFVLKHAAILERVVIRQHTWYNPLCSERCKVIRQWKNGERQKVYERLLEFSRNARVSCLF